MSLSRSLEEVHVYYLRESDSNRVPRVDAWRKTGSNKHEMVFFCQETYLTRLDMFENSLLNIIHLKWKGSSSIRSHSDLTLNLYKRVLQRSFQPFHLILSFLHLIDGLSWFLMERVLMFDEGLVSSCWSIKQEGFECTSNERQREKRKKNETERVRERMWEWERERERDR